MPLMNLYLGETRWFTMKYANREVVYPHIPNVLMQYIELVLSQQVFI